MENKPGDVKVQTETAEAPTTAKTATPSRKRYSRAQLMHFRDTIDLTAPPVGYNPAILKPVEPLNKDLPPMARDGMKWNRSRSMREWTPQNQGSKGGMPFSRLAEGEDIPNGPGPLRGGRALRSAISWNEQHSGALQAAEKGFARRNSRSDAPGRWDNNKDEQLSKSIEKGGPEKWKSYGHKDTKEKVPSKATKDEECIDNPPQDMTYHGHEPEWMYHRPSAENPELMKQHRQFAADFEEERKLMREKIAKENKERNTERGESSLFMTDEEINDYKKELEAEERGISSSAFTFDSLKEALKSQGVSNLPPMPTSGISTVDQIEKSLKASASAQQQQQRVAVSEFGRQQLELLKVAGAQPGTVPNPTTTANIEGANRLLSMLRGQVRPTGSFGNMNPATQLQQPISGFPVNLPQQQGLFSGNNPQLERLFAANPRAGGNLGLPGYGAQQPQMHPGMGNVPPIPFMQQAGHLNQRGAQHQNNLLSALLANQQAQNVHHKQAQMMAQLRQAQQQTALQAARAESEAPAVAGQDSNEDDGDSKGNAVSGPVPHGMMGLLPGVAGNVQNPAPLSSFGLPGNLMGVRPSMPTGPAMFNPSVGNIPIGGNPQEALFPGGLPPAINPAGLGGHPAFLMQNGGGLGRPMGHGLAGLNLPGIRPGMGAPLGHMMDDRQLPGFNNQPNAVHANLLAAQQNSGGSLNRFFGENNMGTPGAFSADPPTVAPVRNRSLEELKNEAQ